VVWRPGETGGEKTKMKPKEPKHYEILICRDNDPYGYDSDYKAYPANAAPTHKLWDKYKRKGRYWYYARYQMCAEGFEETTGIKLRPGQGPVRVRLTIVSERPKSKQRRRR
jgi:hypothetical protein